MAVPTHHASTAAVTAGRAGLAARGVVYLLVGLVALLLAVQKHGPHADQKGALSTLAGKPFGKLLVIVIAIGLAGYALWMLAQVFLGVAGEEDSTAKRLPCLGSAVLYAGLCVTCITVLHGSGTSQSSQQETLTARVMHHSGGRLLVGVVGVIVIVVGGALVWTGVTDDFMDRMRAVPGQSRDVVRWLGRVGTVGRGVVVGLAGALVLDAAVTYDPNKARGIDGVLRTLLRQPFGRVLTALAALGLLAFGAFGLLEARYRDVQPRG